MKFYLDDNFIQMGNPVNKFSFFNSHAKVFSGKSVCTFAEENINYFESWNIIT
jgi:hypothetical protein